MVSSYKNTNPNNNSHLPAWQQNKTTKKRTSPNLLRYVFTSTSSSLHLFSYIEKHEELKNNWLPVPDFLWKKNKEITQEHRITLESLPLCQKNKKKYK